MIADVKIYFITPDNTQTEITGRVDGLDRLEVTLRDDLTKSFTSELEFYDDGYDILKLWLLNDANALINEVKVKIYDTCCNTLVIDGVIRATTIDWCEPICSIKANIIEGKEAVDCLKSTLIWDDSTEDESGLTFLEREQKRLRYCVDLSPTGLLIILLVFYVIFSLILNVLGLILTFFAGLAFLFSFGFLDFQDTLDQFTGWIDELQERMIICNWYHPTALVRDYVKNVCQKCGLTFQSSILNNNGSAYYNTLLFAAQVRKDISHQKLREILLSKICPLKLLRL
jgi:hypothetical protein